MQLVHCGRIAHPLNLPAGARMLAPSAITAANDMPLYDAIEADYSWLAEQLKSIGVTYIHLVDHSQMGAPVVPDSMKQTFRPEVSGYLGDYMERTMTSATQRKRYEEKPLM